MSGTSLPSDTITIERASYPTDFTKGKFSNQMFKLKNTTVKSKRIDSSPGIQRNNEI
jgi:hypothetical protein